jgi:riboflavin biosynthesis pyrimidine reductase
VSDDDAGTQFTLLNPAAPIDTARLASLYAYPDRLDRCWVRANMIASLDGAATVEGRAGGLAGGGDRAVFKVMRAVADVILVGAGTVRAENYSGAQLDVVGRQRRQAEGQSEVPPIAVVTGTGALDPDSRLFTRTEVPPLIFTTTASFAATSDRLNGIAEVIDASRADPIAVDPTAVLAELGRRGLHRVLCEGGPRLLGDVVAAGLLDELALTIAPMLVAGGAPRVVAGPPSPTAGMRTEHILTDEDGYLYTRYVRVR